MGIYKRGKLHSARRTCVDGSIGCALGPHPPCSRFALVGAGPALSWFRDFIFGDLLTILSVSEDSRSFMGGSDVVHCVRVPSIGTTVAEFWACGSLVGIGLCTITYYVYYIVDIGAPSLLLCDGPTP